ncbi:AbrB/MazE/SpoVT family DNA-binding domain-containing protein [Candidatus Woesearchaeota archaeon]|nr:AbrB/MazE/SpoVT family DNA-binding domain-containing protein [Candidatus Woesearchaeota archaeon]
MKRKVNRVGQNTLTVSLPVRWVQKHEVNAGDELEIEEQGKNLVIVKEKAGKRIKRVALDLDNFNKMMLNRYIHEFYRQGAEEIVLNFTKDAIPDYKKGGSIAIDKRVRRLLERFIGMEIVSKTKKKIVLQSLMTEEETGKIAVVQKRVYFLIKEFFDEFISSMDDGFSAFHDKCYDYHDNIAKFLYYYLRLLHFSDILDEKKARLFGLFMVIDGVIDKARHTSERINEMKTITPKVKKYVREIFVLFLEQFDLIFKKNYSMDDLEALIKKRYNLVKRVNSEKFTGDGLIVMSECKVILDTINDFSETFVALNVEKYVKEF